MLRGAGSGHRKVGLLVTGEIIQTAGSPSPPWPVTHGNGTAVFMMWRPLGPPNLSCMFGTVDQLPIRFALAAGAGATKRIKPP